MSLLDPWRHLADVGTVIPCREMRLDARDWEKPIICGGGEVRVASDAAFSYVICGVPEDVAHTLRSLHRQRENPYDGLMRFRLSVVDEAGRHLGFGWTVPRFERGKDVETWTFSGETEGVWVDDEHAGEEGTEVLYLLPQHHRVRPMLARFISSTGSSGEIVPEHELEVLSTRLRFALDEAAGTLSIRASASEGLPQTYTENWLAEPLRIMFGQLIFPRMVARANPDRTIVSVRPTSGWNLDSDWTALWNGPAAFFDTEGFWRTYAGLLSFVATARDNRGRPNFEANKVTQFYEEVIQASRGSRWVWALTFASSIEGLTRMLVPRGTPRAVADLDGITDLKQHIDTWPGSDLHLKRVAKNAVARTAETSTVQALRELRDSGVLAADQVKAWETIRNQVMHGSLVSPYSSKDDDQLLLNLAALMHALTRRLAGL